MSAMHRLDDVFSGIFSDNRGGSRVFLEDFWPMETGYFMNNECSNEIENRKLNPFLLKHPKLDLAT